jgi:excisionase family DNA binding protein
LLDLFKEFYTVKEAAEYFNVSKRTIYNWIDAGIIRAVHVGNTFTIRIPACELGRIKREALLTPPTPLSDEIKDTIKSRS